MLSEMFYVRQTLISFIVGRLSREEIENFEIVYPVKVSASGSVISHKLRHFIHRSSHARSGSIDYNSTIYYKVAIDHKDKHVALQPNFDIVAPGSVVEYRKSQGSQGFPEVTFKPLSEDHCHFHGHVIGEAGSRAALSTCNGLAGYLILDQKLYYIEPADEYTNHGSLHPHILYHGDDQQNVNNQDSFCGTKANGKHPLLHMEKAKQDNLRLHHNIHAKESKEYFLETLVVADKTMIAYHKNMDLEQYILTIFNMAYNMFHDASLGAHINLVLVRIIRLEEEEKEMNNAIVSSAQETLQSFCAWADRQNPLDESHPNHHDVSVLMTRVDLCESGEACGLLGLAYTGGACSRSAQCSVNEDNGLLLGFVVAHEIGHNLGMNHDTMEETGCPAELPGGAITVMSPYVSMDITEWSSCSRTALIKFLDEEKGTCMEDRPKEPRFKIDDMLPGVMYGGTYQCRQIFEPTSRQCEQGFNCETLVCEVPNFGCFKSNVIPAPGTPCGENKWCYHRKCLTVGERPGAVDGEWGNWSNWNKCSRSCGVAVAHKTRACDNPPPAHGGRYCIGERKRFELCDTKPCPEGHPSFREEQCSAFNTADITWKPYYWHTENFCSLICQNNRNSVEMKSSVVQDGTQCMRGIRDICIGALCKTIPCDDDLMSEAVEDACGMCHGDGTSCTVQRGTRTFAQRKGVLTNLLEVPVGATNIQVEEMSPTNAKIVVLFKKKPVNKGYPTGKFQIGDSGMSGWMGMLQNQQELLYIKGPTTQPLTVSVHAGEEVTLSYSMGVRAKTQRKPHFHWNFAEWSECSADCGVGTQVSHAQCMEQEAGLVEKIHCKHITQPEPLVKTCELRPCSL